MSDKPYYDEFYRWFKALQYKTGSCFERDVIRDCKDALYVAYAARAAEFDEKV